jgi:hypothetical protein
MARSRRANKDAPLWREFAGRHPGNPFLELDPLYSLPAALLDIIAGKAEGSVTERTGVAPGFLTEEEVAFERDLARTVSGQLPQGVLGPPPTG